MSRSCRIDEIKENADGTFEVFYTAGPAPLPVARSGMSLQFANRADYAQMMAEVDESLSDRQLVAMASAPWFKADPQMKSLATVRSKAVAIDLAGAVAAITLS